MKQAKMFFQKLLHPSKWVLILCRHFPLLRCVGIHDLLYVGVFSYDMSCSTSAADKGNKICYYE